MFDRTFDITQRPDLIFWAVVLHFDAAGSHFVCGGVILPKTHASVGVGTVGCRLSRLHK